MLGICEYDIVVPVPCISNRPSASGRLRLSSHSPVVMMTCGLRFMKPPVLLVRILQTGRVDVYVVADSEGWSRRVRKRVSDDVWCRV